MKLDPHEAQAIAKMRALMARRAKIDLAVHEISLRLMRRNQDALRGVYRARIAREGALFPWQIFLMGESSGRRDPDQRPCPACGEPVGTGPTYGLRDPRGGFGTENVAVEGDRPHFVHFRLGVDVHRDCVPAEERERYSWD